MEYAPLQFTFPLSLNHYDALIALYPTSLYGPPDSVALSEIKGSLDVEWSRVASVGKGGVLVSCNASSLTYPNSIPPNHRFPIESIQT